MQIQSFKNYNTILLIFQDEILKSQVSFFNQNYNSETSSIIKRCQFVLLSFIQYPGKELSCLNVIVLKLLKGFLHSFPHKQTDEKLLT